MRYWQKIYLATLALFLFALNLGAYFLADEAYRNALAAERERAFAEHSFLSNAIAKDILAITARGEDTKSISRLYESYADYFYGQGLYLALRGSGGGIAYSNLPSDIGTPGMQPAATQAAALSPEEGTPYLYVEGNVAGTGYSLITARAEDALAERARGLTRALVSGSACIALVLSLVLAPVLKRLTQPIRALTRAAREITGGGLAVRADVQDRTEMGALAQSFNRMADEIQKQITALETASLQKQRFIDDLAHEMRTPLTAIGGYAQYLLSANASEDERISALSYIQKESARLSEVSEKLLLLATLRQGEPARVLVALAALFEEISAALEGEARLRGVTLHIHVCGAVWKSDETLLYMLFLNLAQNALRACGENGNIYLSAEGACASVRDDGCGIAAQDLEHIAEPFYRVDASRSRSMGGAGLGLSICAQIVDRLSLSLRFDSAPGAGTTVYVRDDSQHLQFANNSVETSTQASDTMTPSAERG